MLGGRWVSRMHIWPKTCRSISIHTRSGLGRYKDGKNILMEASPIDAYHNPRVGQKKIRLLESFYVFVSKDLLAYALCNVCGIRCYLEFAMVK